MLHRRHRTDDLRLRAETPTDAAALAGLARGRDPVPRPRVVAEAGGRVVGACGPDGRVRAVRRAGAARAVLRAHAAAR